MGLGVEVWLAAASAETGRGAGISRQMMSQSRASANSRSRSRRGYGVSMKEFQIDVPQADLDDLTLRLSLTRYPDELPGSGWDYGMDLGTLRRFVDSPLSDRSPGI